MTSGVKILDLDDVKLFAKGCLGEDVVGGVEQVSLLIQHLHSDLVLSRISNRDFGSYNHTF